MVLLCEFSSLIFRQNFIRTLEILANSNDPVKTFYDGNLTKTMISEFKANGGIITEEDFRSYKSILRSDDEVIYADIGNGIRGCGPPPVRTKIFGK